MELKDRLIQAKEQIEQAGDQSLQAFYFENPRDEETAWLLAEPKGERGSSTFPFEVSAMAFLLQKGFLEKEGLANLPGADFTELDVETAKSIISCTPVKVTQEAADDLNNLSKAIAVYNDWNYRIFMLEGAASKLCFAWMTSA